MWRGIWVHGSQRGLRIRTDEPRPLQSGRRRQAWSVLSVSIVSCRLRYQQVHFPTRGRWWCFSCVTICRKMEFSRKSHGGILVVVKLESTEDSGLLQMMWQERRVGRHTSAQGPFISCLPTKKAKKVSDTFFGPRPRLLCVADFSSFHFTPITTYTFVQLYFHPAGSLSNATLFHPASFRGCCLGLIGQAIYYPSQLLRLSQLAQCNS